MNGPPSREEVDTKLDNVRMSAEVFFARMDARCARMEAAFEAHLREMDLKLAKITEEFAARLDAKIAALYKAMIITAITSTLTIILGVGAINATVFTGMLAALDKGEELGAMYTKLGQRMLEQDAQFNRMMLKQREDFARMETKQRENFARMETKQRENFASLETKLDARLEEEKAERARQRKQRAPRR